jgi:predicted nucleic acid-binding protein
MILYLDASALVKLYLMNERGAERVARVREKAERVGTSILSRAEVVSAVANAVRMDVLLSEEARRLRTNF